jgi:hypothetical protein
MSASTINGGPSSRGMGPVDKSPWTNSAEGALSVGGNRFLIPKDKENKWRFEQ